MAATSISYLAVENGLFEIQIRLAHKYGWEQAEQELYPLSWYINTGRASADFLRLLLEAKPYMIARKLHEGGTIQEAMDRIKKYLNY